MRDAEVEDHLPEHARSITPKRLATISLLITVTPFAMILTVLVSIVITRKERDEGPSPRTTSSQQLRQLPLKAVTLRTSRDMRHCWGLTSRGSQVGRGG